LEQTRSQRTLDFLVAAADWLSNDDDIIGIRSRVSSGERLDRIIDEEKRAAAMGFSHVLGVVVMPLAVVVIGLMVAGRRKKIAVQSTVQGTGEAEGKGG
jgi:ABC-type uncharacterized transport system involved in gliding motility auxiliary subunit